MIQGDSTEATRRTTGVVHGAVETVLEKMKTDHAASVVAINGQKLAKHDLTALMQALSLSWEKSTSSCGAQSCVRKLYLGQDEIGDEGASCIAESLKVNSIFYNKPIGVLHVIDEYRNQEYWIDHLFHMYLNILYDYM